MNTRKLTLDRICATPEAQPRMWLDSDTIDEYAAAMKAGAKFPPVVVFRDGDGTHWLGDGFQRLEAARRNEAKTLLAEGRAGGSGAPVIVTAPSARRSSWCRRMQQFSAAPQGGR